LPFSELEVDDDHLSAKPDGAWGGVSSLDLEGRTIWIADAHRDGKRFIVRADELLTAFLDLGKGDTRVRGEFIVVRLSPLSEIAVVLVGA